MPAAAHVVDFAGARIFEEFVESADEIRAVNVVANLFALVPEDFVRRAGGRALHEVCEETM